MKRSANFGKSSVESKKSKLSPPSKTQDKDKKQMIKDQLKLLESALSKKKAMTKWIFLNYYEFLVDFLF